MFDLGDQVITMYFDFHHGLLPLSLSLSSLDLGKTKCRVVRRAPHGEELRLPASCHVNELGRCPPAPAKSSYDCRPSQHQHYNFMKDTSQSHPAKLPPNS